MVSFLTMGRLNRWARTLATCRKTWSCPVIAAARAAGVHDMIVCLAEGTKLGSARAAPLALYGDPFLVVLDEPNSG